MGNTNGSLSTPKRLSFSQRDGLSLSIPFKINELSLGTSILPNKGVKRTGQNSFGIFSCSSLKRGIFTNEGKKLPRENITLRTFPAIEAPFVSLSGDFLWNEKRNRIFMIKEESLCVFGFSSTTGTLKKTQSFQEKISHFSFFKNDLVCVGTEQGVLYFSTFGLQILKKKSLFGSKKDSIVVGIPLETANDLVLIGNHGEAFRLAFPGLRQKWRSRIIEKTLVHAEKTPDEQFLLAGSSDNLLLLVEIQSGQVIRKFQDFKGQPLLLWSFKFSLCGKWLFVLANEAVFCLRFSKELCKLALVCRNPNPSQFESLTAMDLFWRQRLILFGNEDGDVFLMEIIEKQLA